MDKKSPTVSVVTVTYNHGRFLPEVIESVLSQTFEDWELIVVDDGSEDETPKIISHYLIDERIRYIKQFHSGRPVARNRGLSEAHGEFMAVLDADDRALPDRLAVQIDYLRKHPQVVAVGSWAYVIDQEGVRRGELRPPLKPGEIKRAVMWFMPCIHSSFMIRTEILKKTGGYREDFPLAQDYDLVMRLTEDYQVANIPRFLTEYRRFSKPSFSKLLTQRIVGVRVRWSGLHRSRKNFSNYGAFMFGIASLLIPWRILKFLGCRWIPGIDWQATLPEK